METPPPPPRVLLEYPYPVQRLEVSGGSLAYVEVGAGRPVVFVHGNPTWGFLWRRVLHALAGAPLRLLAPDLLGFGRSSKPRSVRWHSLVSHAGTLVEWMAALDLRDAVLVVQDWG